LILVFARNAENYQACMSFLLSTEAEGWVDNGWGYKLNELLFGNVGYSACIRCMHALIACFGKKNTWLEGSGNSKFQTM
jgi:hypothetical protein